MGIQNKLCFPILAIILACSISAQASDDRVQFLGEYINVRSATGEHCEGYDVMLWKHKGSLIGFLNHHRGLCGDPPMGVMEDISYSAKTGSLSFKVKLSDGLRYKAGKWVPSRDIVEFKGNLRGDVLEGTVTWFRDGEQKPVYTESVMLPKEEERRYGPKYDYETYDDWMKYWEPILKSSRGPQW